MMKNNFLISDESGENPSSANDDFSLEDYQISHLSHLLDSIDTSEDEIDKLFRILDILIHRSTIRMDEGISAHTLIAELIDSGEFTKLENAYFESGKDGVLSLALFAKNVLLKLSVDEKQNAIFKYKTMVTRLGNQRDRARKQLEIANTKIVELSAELELMKRR